MTITGLDSGTPTGSNDLLNIYGDGSDGSKTVAGGEQFTMNGVYQYTDFTVEDGGEVNLDGYAVIFATNQITVNGLVDGGGAADNSGSGAPITDRYSGENGGDASAIDMPNYTTGGGGGDGGASVEFDGGSSDGGVGGVRSDSNWTQTKIDGVKARVNTWAWSDIFDPNITTLIQGAGGGGGGAGGADSLSGGAGGGGGGDGGDGGGGIILVAPHIETDGNATIDLAGEAGFDGGDGGSSDSDGAGGGGGGGGGGSGGIAILVAETINDAAGYALVGGAGGNGGLGGSGGTGDGEDGEDGDPGADGEAIRITP